MDRPKYDQVDGGRGEAKHNRHRGEIGLRRNSDDHQAKCRCHEDRGQQGRDLPCALHPGKRGPLQRYVEKRQKKNKRGSHLYEPLRMSSQPGIVVRGHGAFCQENTTRLSGNDAVRQYCAVHCLSHRQGFVI